MSWAHHDDETGGSVRREFPDEEKHQKCYLEGAHLLGKQVGRVFPDKEPRCYLICHGENLGLYMNSGNFMKNCGHLTMAREFSCLEEAQRYCQAVCDDEGRIWGWPSWLFPIYWKKLP